MKRHLDKLKPHTRLFVVLGVLWWFVGIVFLFVGSGMIATAALFGAVAFACMAVVIEEFDD